MADFDHAAGSDSETDRPTGSQSTAIDPAQIGGNTRFYPQDFPTLEELVVVNVKSIAEMGAYVSLLEYNGAEGMILLSELSRRRIRSINRLLRVGRNEVVMVIRVDKEKGYIDLSKRRASPEDIVKAEERFSKAKAVHTIVKHLSIKHKTPMLSLYERIFWPLYRAYGHAYDALQVAVSDPDTILGPATGTIPSGSASWPLNPTAAAAATTKPKGVVIDITPEERAELFDFILAKMKPQPLRIRADIQVTCVKYEGIEAVRAALVSLNTFCCRSLCRLAFSAPSDET
jgi:translation initiation factor 2 subunit 1